MKNRIKEKREVQSKFNLGFIYTILFIALLFLLFTYQLISYTIEIDFRGNILFAFIIFLVFSNIYLIYSFLTLCKIEIVNNQILLVSIFGLSKTIVLKNEIDLCSEEIIEGKNSTRKIFIVYYKSKKLEISSSVYKNYEKLKYEISKGIINKKDESSLVQLSNVTLIFILFIAFSFLYSSYFIYTNNGKSVTSKSNLTTIKQVIESKTENTSKRTRSSVYITIKGYPELEFKLNSNNVFEQINIGDTVLLGIKTIDFQKKISKQVPFGFWDNPIFRNDIEVFTLKTKNNTFITDEENESNPFWIIVIYAFIGFGILIFCILEYV